MADISAFSNATFNPSAWINSVLKNKPDEESLESYLASLAMKIHVVSQDYTDQLENGNLRYYFYCVRATSFSIFYGSLHILHARDDGCYCQYAQSNF